MDFKSIIFVMCIGIAWAQTEPSITDALNKLPPGLQGKIDENQVTEIRNKTVAAFKNKCEENAGPEAYQKAESAFVDFVGCLKALVDPEKLKQEVEEAKPHGQVDEVFKKYCQKTPQFKACFKNMTDTIKPCFSVDEQKNLKTVYNISEQLAEFVCFKEGDRIALFISENGPECIQEKQAEIECCLNGTLGTQMNFKTDNMSLDHFPEINFGEEECDQVGQLQICVVAALETCSAPTSANIVESLFRFALKATPCKDIPSLAGLSLTRDLRPLAALTRLQHLSLTSIKELGWCACEVVGQLEQLESLELGECSFGGSFAAALGKLVKLRRLRLERGVAHCAAPALLRALSALPKLTRLELVNFDVKVGFDDALAECKNIQRLLIIPTYVSQSATTNKQVLSGVLRLKETLTHLMWGVTIELLRVTELFIDQCEAGEGEGEGKRRDVGECIPVLKPVPGCRLPDDHRTVAGPPQVEILPIPTLQRLLSAQLPNTKLKLLRIPFHATWRQSLADFQ